MPITDAQKRAHDKYFRENYQRLTISYPKEYCETVKAAAKNAGESLAGYVKKAIDNRMGHVNDQPTQEQAQVSKSDLPAWDGDLPDWLK